MGGPNERKGRRKVREREEMGGNRKHGRGG